MGWFLAALALAGVLLSACIALVVWGLAGTGPFDIAVGNDRPRLDPIPIPETACPIVEVIHREADHFQQTYTNARFATLVVEDTDAPWPDQKQELDDAARSLDLAIALGAPAFPPRITKHLNLVRQALHDGRTLLATTTRPARLIRVDDVFRDGQEQFGYASDLIGRQCPVPLRANSYTLVPASTTTTASVPGPALP